MAYVGDVTPYERRQPVLGRYLSGPDLRPAFRPGGGRRARRPVRLAQRVLRARRPVRARDRGADLRAPDQSSRRARPTRPEETSRGFVADYVAVLSNRLARIVILAVLIEAAIGWGAFAYVGADLNQRFGLGFTAVGLIVGTFALGGLIYAGDGAAARQPARTARPRHWRRAPVRHRLSDARDRRRLVARADRGDDDRARLLCAAQHAADQRHADDTGSARNRGRDLLLGDLSRPDRRRRRGRLRLRPLRRRCRCLP